MTEIICGVAGALSVGSEAFVLTGLALRWWGRGGKGGVSDKKSQILTQI
jgi:hypothetical protein